MRKPNSKRMRACQNGDLKNAIPILKLDFKGSLHTGCGGVAPGASRPVSTPRPKDCPGLGDPNSLKLYIF